MKMRGLDPMPSARELRAMAAARGVAVPPNGPVAPSKPKGHTLRPWHPYRSKWELEYARYLDVLKAAGRVEEWVYEPDRLTIGVRAVYTPDFLVSTSATKWEYHEVKGYRREAAMVRLKAAALRYPENRFVLVTKIKGEWHYTPISPPPEAAHG